MYRSLLSRWGANLIGLTLFLFTYKHPALAATPPGFDVQSFRPTPGPRDLVIVPQTEALSHLSVSAGVFFSFSLDPLALFNSSSGQKIADVVKNRVELDVMAAIGFAIKKFSFEIGVIIPTILYQTGDNLHDLQQERTVGPTRLGDISLIAKVPIITRKIPDVGFGLAASLRVNAPSGSVSDFTSDGSFTFNPTLIADYRFKRTGILLAAAAGVYFRPTVTLIESDGPRLGPMFTAQAGAEFPLKRDWGVTAIAGFYANVPLTTPITQGKGCVPAEALVGLRWYSSNTRITFTSGFNFGMDCGLGVPTLRYWLSAIFIPPKMIEQERIDFFKSGKCPEKRLLPTDKPFAQCPLVFRKENKIVVLPGIQFILDEDQVDPASYTILDQVVDEVKKALKQDPNVVILIGAHTDKRGPKGNEYNYNINLSQKRATWAFNFLKQHDIPPQRMAAVGYGYTVDLPKDELPDGNLTEEDIFYLSRRVDFWIVTPAEAQYAVSQAPKLSGATAPINKPDNNLTKPDSKPLEKQPKRPGSQKK